MASPADPEVYDGVGNHLQQLVAVNVVLWLASLVIGKAWPVDFIWSSWPIYHAMALRPGAGALGRAEVVVVTIAAWGLRLTGNFVRRGGRSPRPRRSVPPGRCSCAHQPQAPDRPGIPNHPGRVSSMLSREKVISRKRSGFCGFRR